MRKENLISSLPVFMVSSILIGFGILAYPIPFLFFASFFCGSTILTIELFSIYYYEKQIKSQPILSKEM